jgi:hypothetical protein
MIMLEARSHSVTTLDHLASSMRRLLDSGCHLSDPPVNYVGTHIHVMIPTARSEALTAFALLVFTPLTGRMRLACRLSSAPYCAPRSQCLQRFPGHVDKKC